MAGTRNLASVDGNNTMIHTHHPHHQQHIKQAAKRLNIELDAPTQVITDRPSLRVDLTEKPCGLKIITASLAPHPDPAYRQHKQALLDHDQAHIAKAAAYTGAHIVIITTTHDGLHPHQPVAHYQAIRRERKLQLHLFMVDSRTPMGELLHEWPTVPALGY